MKFQVLNFHKIKIERDESLCIRGSDNGLLVYGVHINPSSLVEDLSAVLMFANNIFF